METSKNPICEEVYGKWALGGLLSGSIGGPSGRCEMPVTSLRRLDLTPEWFAP